MESIIEKVSGMKKATFGVDIFTQTEPAMRKTNNPYIGRVTKLTHYIDAVLGVDYQKAVNNRLERNGFEPTYQSEEPKGKKHYNAFFYQSLDGETFYLKIGIYQSTSIVSILFLDGQPATPVQIAQIEPFLQKKSNFVQKQADAGLTETEEQYHIVAPKAQNVVKITEKGGKHIIYQRD